MVSRSIRSIKNSYSRLRLKLSQIYLARVKHEQKHDFNILQSRFSDLYQKLKYFNESKFTTLAWENYNKKIEKVFLPTPFFSFLRDPIIMQTMFVNKGGKWLDEELIFLENRIPKDRLKFLLQEDYVGDPLLLNSTYNTSHNSIHHLYHLIRFQDKTRCNFYKMNTIIEWGGGYGNMAKIYQRLMSSTSTYIIIDTSLFSTVQWLYLTTILGEEKVNLLQKPEDTIHEKKINLIPLCFIDNHKINADLFISTWALSESSNYSQNYVVLNNWFNSKHILLAYQKSNEEFGNAERVGRLAIDSGATIEEIEFLPGNFYAFF